MYHKRNKLYFLSILWGAYIVFALIGGCSPKKHPDARCYTEVTDIKSQYAWSNLDILFVIDNSPSMKPFFEAFKEKLLSMLISLPQTEAGGMQIGWITTDMDDPNHQGKLQGKPKVFRFQDYHLERRKELLRSYFNPSFTGATCEQGLEAVRAALSNKLTQGVNEGFPRTDAILAIIFVSDEDDCSHPGKSPATELLSQAYHIPENVYLKSPTGERVKDGQGHFVTGKLNSLYPTTPYINMLTKRDQTVIVSGVLGDPEVSFSTHTRGPERVSCSTDDDCRTQKYVQKHRCYYDSAQQQVCGGCELKDATAMRASRYMEVSKKFGGIWSSICSPDLTSWTTRYDTGINHYSVPLTRTPLSLESIKVFILTDKIFRTPVLQAPQIDRPCTADSQCGETFVCGSDNKCYGDGWVYFPPTMSAPQARLRLSGRAVWELLPSDKLKQLHIIYPAICSQ